MLSPLYQDHGGSVVWPHTFSCSSSSQALHRELCYNSPRISGSSVDPNPTHYHAVYDVKVEEYSELPFSGGESVDGDPFGQGTSPLVTNGNNDPTAPLIRRRGGTVDYRDVILAHQAHKLHNTPQAKRKQWEGVPAFQISCMTCQVVNMKGGGSFLF